MSRKKKKPASQKNRSQVAESKTNPTTPDKLAAKKAAVLGNEKKNRQPMLVVLTCAVLAAGAIFFFINSHRKGNFNVTEPRLNTSTQTATRFTFPVALFEDGNARHYEYKGQGVTIKYFILKSSDGVIRAAFDACDVCWRAGKGYYQVGDYMVCRNCGQRFASVRVNEVKGGCNPSPLNRSIEGDSVVITVNDIIDGAKYFNFL